MHEDFGLHFWLTRWNLDPSILIGTVLVIDCYLYGVGPLRKKYRLADTVKRSQIVLFIIGVLVIFFALASPLDALGDDYLFSAHMAQHMLLSLVGPPLMLAGIPGWLLRPLLRNRIIFRMGKWLTFPFVAFILFNADIWIWHAPPVYEAALASDSLHFIEHITFLVTGFIFWWPILSQSEELPALPIGGRILYIFLGDMPMVLLGAGLTFTPPLYTWYINQTVRAYGLSAATDQQLGGLAMWVPGSILLIVIMSILFISWMRQQDVKQRERDALLYGTDDETEIQVEENETAEHPS
jgi:cytochrome c oxidase assembly factor CtaG